jgi:hypothetical protein
MAHGRRQTPVSIKVSLIGLIGAIVLAAGTIIAAFITRQSSPPPNAQSTSDITSSKATSEPTSSTTFAFDFETGTQNWGTSEGAFKLAKVDLTNNPVHSGTHALQVTTALLGDGNPAYTPTKEVYRHTEAKVYFDQRAPNGFNIRGPYNLTGKQVSCFVYLPGGLAPEGNPQAYIKLFVKDKKFANDFSKAVDIDASHLERWFLLSFVIGADKTDADATFDATQVNALGVRIDTVSKSTLDYTGPFYIDDCAIEH